MTVPGTSVTATAASPDGLNFTIDGDVAVGSGPASYDGSIASAVVRASDGIVELYVAGPDGILRSESTDQTGRTFHPSTNVLRTSQLVSVSSHISFGDYIGDPSVIQLQDGTYRMVIKHSPFGGSFSDHQVFGATSADGVNWSLTSAAPLCSGSVPDVVQLPSGDFRIYYVIPHP
jgi:hypothetical protein